MTKIDDERGARNEQLLIRKNRLWWFTDMSMYVYYSPTHWRRAADQSNSVHDSSVSTQREQG